MAWLHNPGHYPRKCRGTQVPSKEETLVNPLDPRTPTNPCLPSPAPPRLGVSSLPNVRCVHPPLPAQRSTSVRTPALASPVTKLATKTAIPRCTFSGSGLVPNTRGNSPCAQQWGDPARHAPGQGLVLALSVPPCAQSLAPRTAHIPTATWPALTLCAVSAPRPAGRTGDAFEAAGGHGMPGVAQPGGAEGGVAREELFKDESYRAGLARLGLREAEVSPPHTHRPLASLHDARRLQSFPCCMVQSRWPAAGRGVGTLPTPGPSPPSQDIEAMQQQWDSVDHELAPMVLVKYEAFKAHGRIPRSDERLSVPLHVAAAGAGTGFRVVFVSHNWVRGDEDQCKNNGHLWEGQPHPDDEKGSKHTLVCEGVEALAREKKWDLPKVHLWVDYTCIEQDPDGDSYERKLAGVKSLRGYVTVCDTVLVPYPKPPPEGAKTIAQLEVYGDRAWTRLEALVCYVVGVLKGLDAPELRVAWRGEEGVLGLRLLDYSLDDEHLPEKGVLKENKDREEIKVAGPCHPARMLSVCSPCTASGPCRSGATGVVVVVAAADERKAWGADLACACCCRLTRTRSWRR